MSICSFIRQWDIFKAMEWKVRDNNAQSRWTRGFAITKGTTFKMRRWCWGKIGGGFCRLVIAVLRWPWKNRYGHLTFFLSSIELDLFRCSFKVTGTRANVANCLSTGRPPLKKTPKRFVTTYTWRQISLWWWGCWFLTVAFLVTTGVVWALQVANVVVSLLYTSVTGTRCRRLARRTPKK